ncbi:MAG: hypothetical protein CSA52_02380 [Gammaproteobacteria bacterium]|nr:MAG: hypothetical protein CSB48_06365 [Pseudomonadota bacterium]PIE38436.1 MAG: hypothetical protein CSA52_02380 [Gammaproteobacteria bacterium]
MESIRVTRNAVIPDPLRISRYQKAPEFGPRILFFSGGSAINGLSKTLKGYTHNSIHLVTPFDSGGSSAKLRDAFTMPAIGDLRSRLLALADETVTGHPEVFRLFNYRLPKNKPQSELKEMLAALAAGKAPLIEDITNPMRSLIRYQLGFFQDAMPKDFDLRGASIGNLILAGGYLNNHQHLDPIIFLFSKLVNVLGTVRALVNKNLHLAADLEDGRRVNGQHRLTGKEVEPLTSPIKRLYLSQDRDQLVPGHAQLRKKVRKLIESAELICYPPGSFYSSLIANLIPAGVGKAIAANDCPKIYIPNLGHDPEQTGMNTTQAIDSILCQLRKDAGKDTPTSSLVNFVLLDSQNGIYGTPVSPDEIKKRGICLIDTKLVSKQSAPYYDNNLLVSALLSLV